jgi:Zn ribbon nucleic-acid-binding protein
MKTFETTTTCSKCGEFRASIRYNSGEDTIERTCIRCGYRWREAPLDSDKQPVSVEFVIPAAAGRTSSTSRTSPVAERLKKMLAS